MESMHRVTEIEPLENTLSELRKVPTEYYFLGVGATILMSLMLFMSGRRWSSLFIGLWAPTILSFGLFNKLLGPTRPTR